MPNAHSIPVQSNPPALSLFNPTDHQHRTSTTTGPIPKMRPIFTGINNTPTKKTPTKKPNSVPPKNSNQPALEQKERQKTPQPKLKPDMVVSPSRRTLFQKPQLEKSPAKKTYQPGRKTPLQIPAAHCQLM